MVIPRILPATYVCHFISNDGNIQYQWLVNGTRLEDLNLGDRVEVVNTIAASVLSFVNIPEEYNDTTIQCIANFTSGDRERILISNNAILLVQGEEKLLALYVYIIHVTNCGRVRLLFLSMNHISCFWYVLV